MVLQFFVLIFIYHELTVVSLRGYFDLLVFFNQCSMPLTKTSSRKKSPNGNKFLNVGKSEIITQNKFLFDSATSRPLWLVAECDEPDRFTSLILTCLRICLHMATKHNGPGRWTQQPPLPLAETTWAAIIIDITSVIFILPSPYVVFFGIHGGIIFWCTIVTKAIYIPFFL